jgi:hypothetical protein
MRLISESGALLSSGRWALATSRTITALTALTALRTTFVDSGCDPLFDVGQLLGGFGLGQTTFLDRSVDALGLGADLGIDDGLHVDTIGLGDLGKGLAVFEGGTQLVDVDSEQVGRCLGPLGPALTSSAAFAVGGCVSRLFDCRIDWDGVIDLGAHDAGADEASCDECGADETGANALVHDVLSFKGMLGDSLSG